MAKGLWVLLNVDNVDKSLEFYRMLGLRAKRGSEGGMSWGEVHATSESGVILWDKRQVGPGQDAAEVQAWLSGEMGKGVMLNFGVGDARKAWARAEGKATVEQPLQDDPWGGRSFTLVDPDGYVVNVQDKFPGDPPKKRASAKKAKRPAGAKKAKRAAPAKKTRAKRAAKKRRARRG